MAHEPTFSCPRCGERLPAGFTRCDACGAYLVPAPGGGAGRAKPPRGDRAGSHAPTAKASSGGIPTIAWVFLLIGIGCGGAVGYSLHSAGGRAVGNAMPTGPADVMSGSGAPMSGGAMPADVMTEIQRYRAVLARDPNDLQANIGLGNLEFDSGQWQKAVEHYQLALTKDPGNADVRVDMAIAMHNQGNDAEAVKELERVNKDHPDHKNAWLNLGVICAGMGDRQAAIRAWERYLALDPNGQHAESIRQQIEELKRG
jgi:hypothetical protein